MESPSEYLDVPKMRLGRDLQDWQKEEAASMRRISTREYRINVQTR
jgi:hypothetical protein